MAYRFCGSCFFLHLLLLSLCCCLKGDDSAVTDTLEWGQSLSGSRSLVSKKGTFKLGFFTPGKTQRHYIGIWYWGQSERTVVWVANRSTPVVNRSSSELTITADGNLVLLNESKMEIWSSGMIPRNNTDSTVVTLLETGNLAVLNKSEPSTIYWQSFDHPTDTWLPGARIGWNEAAKKYVALTSWRSKDDPAPGYYYFGMDPKGRSQLVQMWNGSETYWVSGEWNGAYFNSVSELTVDNNYKFTFTESDNYTTYSNLDAMVLMRFVLDVSGKGNHWTFEYDPRWVLDWTKPENQCQVPLICGPFSVCHESSVPLCNCLPGFEPPSMISEYWNIGCVRRTPLQCKNASSSNRDGFMTIILQAELPARMEVFVMQNSTNCMAECLKNCSCIAYKYYGAECQLWREVIRDLKLPTDFERSKKTINLRLASSELLRARSRKGLEIVLTLSVGGFLFLAAALLVICRYRYRRRGRRLTPLRNRAIEGPLLLFSYRELRSFTKNFSLRLGRGGFGSVFRGELPDSTAIAVKRLEGFRQGEKQFRAEVSTMGVIHHVNLARLRGFCCEADKRLLVYDYMPNASLDSVLFSTNTVTMSWEKRYKIALGTARGLAYLHEECRDCIIHCDIKPENVLLDEQFCAKVADFGMAKLLGRDFSRVLTTMRGTIGYLAPEWISGLPITPKADVYSFGMLLFELISGKRNSSKDVDGDERFYFFPIWAAVKISSNDDNVLDLLDPRLEGNANVEELCRACKVACWCIQDFESDRPSMGQVVQMLDGITEVMVPPVPIALKLLVDHADSTGFASELLPSEPSTLDNIASIYIST